MAQKASFPINEGKMTNSMARAFEAAQLDDEQTSMSETHKAEPSSEHEPQKQERGGVRKLSVKFDASSYNKEKPDKRPVTFSIDNRIKIAIDNAARRLDITRSEVVETAFSAWWDEAQKFVPEK